MLVMFDANMLIWLFDDQIRRAPIDPQTRLELPFCKERIEHLLSELAAQQQQVVIAAPALTEALVHVEAAARDKILDRIRKSAALRIEPYGEVIAVECAELLKKRLVSKGSLGTGEPGGRVLVKFDLQIVATAIVAGCAIIYSTDPGVIELATTNGVRAIAVWDLPAPTKASQIPLDFQQSQNTPELPGGAGQQPFEI